MTIAIGSDHGGYELKLEVIKHLKDRGFEVTDYGCDSTASCDYPIYGKAVAEAIAAGKQDLGILICGTGIGMSMVANKVEGVRAALCSDCFSAQATREHNQRTLHGRTYNRTWSCTYDRGQIRGYTILKR